MRKATVEDLFGSKQSSENTVTCENIREYRMQKEYGEKKFIKP